MCFFTLLSAALQSLSVKMYFQYILILYCLQTSVVQEVRQWFAPWVSQVVRLYADSRALELEWTIGPLPIE